MEPQTTIRERAANAAHTTITRLSRFRVRLIIVTVVCVAAGAVGAGLAFARNTTTIGTGVVVVNTKVAYQGGAAAGTGIVLTSTGEVLTNNHVIQGATSVAVVVPGDRFLNSSTISSTHSTTPNRKAGLRLQSSPWLPSSVFSRGVRR